MVKGRFTVNPFKELVLTPGDISNLHEISSAILDANLSRYEDYINVDKSTINLTQWKLVKAKDSTRVYQEKATGTSTAVPLPQASGSSKDLPSLLCVGTTVGDMEDMMFGVVNPTLEIMRIKASYVEDLSGAAVLANIVDPTLENPFNSLVVKWMEIDIPLQSMGLVRNRDYIYVEATGFVHLANGEKVGYHILHSVAFPETHELPNRVRANLSICGFFRQVRPNASEIFVTGLMDPGGDMIRMLVVPSMANAFLSTLKYAHCGQMKKLAYMLEKRYAEAKDLGTPNREHVCVTCSQPITNRRLGDFGKSDATCKLCFGYVCGGCKIQRKLSFVTPDLLRSAPRQPTQQERNSYHPWVGCRSSTRTTTAPRQVPFRSMRRVVDKFTGNEVFDIYVNYGCERRTVVYALQFRFAVERAYHKASLN